MKKFFGILFTILLLLVGLFIVNEEFKTSRIKKGDMSHSGGTPTYRTKDTINIHMEDDYSTTNDESNDQPVGFYGTDTMYVCNNSSGNCYYLDVDSTGEELERIYFPKGGWVDIEYSDCSGGYCVAEDENGTEWELEY